MMLIGTVLIVVSLLVDTCLPAGDLSQLWWLKVL